MNVFKTVTNKGLVHDYGMCVFLPHNCRFVLHNTTSMIAHVYNTHREQSQHYET